MTTQPERLLFKCWRCPQRFRELTTLLEHFWGQHWLAMVYDPHAHRN